MKALFYIFICLSLIGCTSNTILKKPNDLIDKDTMVNLLFDLYIANSSKYETNKNGKSNINYLPLVYDKYGIDSTRFYKSNFYYISKMEEYQKMFVEVENRLKAIKKKVSKHLEQKQYQEEIKRYPFKAYPIPNVGPFQIYDKSRFVKKVPLLIREEGVTDYYTEGLE